MARLCVCVLLLLCVLQLSDAAVYTQIVQEDPDHPGQCHDSHDGSFHDLGHTWQHQGVCEQRVCGAGFQRGEMVIELLGCGMVVAGPLCTVIPEDNSKPWPSCCSSATCPPGNQDEHQTIVK